MQVSPRGPMRGGAWAGRMGERERHDDALDARGVALDEVSKKRE